MITGYFDPDSAHPQPYVDLEMWIPSVSMDTRVPFRIDTGADLTLLSPDVGMRLRNELGVDLLSLPFGTVIGGIGGEIATRRIQAAIFIGGYIWQGEILLAEPPPGRFIEMPSILGWDIMRHLALFMDYATRRVLLLEPGDAATVSFPDG